MSNFLLRDPYCVHIHIPKTGGSTIRKGIWESRYEGPEFGMIPEAWRKYFKFTFVRHPMDRLVSAWADFSQLRGFRGSMEEFLDIVVDESVIYDERRKTLAERIRHHTIQQTHPFHCLEAADFVGRHETYREDLKTILDRMGVHPLKVPTLRATKRDNWTAYLSGATLLRAVEFYERDFEELDYPRP